MRTHAVISSTLLPCSADPLFLELSGVSLHLEPEGRVVTGPVRGEDCTWWTRISPGTTDAVARALRSLVATLPTPAWREHSRRN
jgi:hypothetical protein